MSEEPKLEELDRLISMGKQKGYLTYDEVNDALPSDVVSLDQLDDIMMMFGAMDIEVVDSAKAGRLPSEVRAATPAPEPTTTATVRSRIDLTPGPVGRTEDPVRLYLREMGRVALLTREGEITLAKRIEEGKDEVTRAILSTNLALERFRELRDKLREGDTSVKDVVDINEEEFTEEKEVELTRVVVKLRQRRSPPARARRPHRASAQAAGQVDEQDPPQGAGGRQGAGLEAHRASGPAAQQGRCSTSLRALNIGNQIIDREDSEPNGADWCSACATARRTSSAAERVIQLWTNGKRPAPAEEVQNLIYVSFR